MKLTIDRTEWYRGQGTAASMLRDYDGMKCCLGFLAEACGYKPEEILCVRTPAYLANKVGQLNGPIKELTMGYFPGIAGSWGDTALCSELMTTNDKIHISGGDAGREQIITDRLKEIGVEVEFIN